MSERERSKNLFRGRLGRYNAGRHSQPLGSAISMLATVFYVQSGCLFLSDMFRGQESIADCQFISDLSSRVIVSLRKSLSSARAVQDSLLLSTRACSSLPPPVAARNVGKSTTCLPASHSPVVRRSLAGAIWGYRPSDPAETPSERESERGAGNCCYRITSPSRPLIMKLLS